MSQRAVLAASLALLLAACTPTGADGQRPDEAPLWDRAGLEAQPRLATYRDALPIELGFDPGTTGWQEAGQALPERLTIDGERQSSPGALLRSLADELDLATSLGIELWEQTQRIHLEGDTAVGMLLQWGFKDDAVLGQDYRLAMREDAAGWYAERLEARYHCARGVSDGLCV